MRLILDLFRRIFEALQGVYTKAESDAALTAEATARQEADTALDERVTAVEPAKDSDWKDYMLARAKLTGVQANIDLVKKAIVDSVALGDSSTLPARMIEDWNALYSHEVFSGEKLNVDFWDAYFEALTDWIKNPVVGEKWEVKDNGDGTYSSSSPYFSAAPTKPVVNFSVVEIRGVTASKTPFHADSNVVVYVPSCKIGSRVFPNGKMNSAFIAPKLESLVYLSVYNNYLNVALVFLSLNNGNGAFESANVLNRNIWVENLTSGRRLFASAQKFNAIVFASKMSEGREAFMNAKLYDQPTGFQSLTSGNAMFKSTAMSAANIASVLNSLPSDPVDKGGTGVISFSRADGTLLAPLMAESPYKESVDAAVARGWTVQFDS
jgi:hypothetical protein